MSWFGSRLPAILLQVLPDLKELRWSYNGTAMMHNQEANVWIMHSKEELGYGDVISTYTMYVGKVCKHEHAELFFFFSGPLLLR